MTNSDIKAKDRKYVLRPWALPPGEPLLFAEARDCVVKDENGKEYIDFTAGYFVNNAGHCHPEIAKAATAQLSKVLQVSGKHSSVAMILLAEKLVLAAGGKMAKVFFATGGSEANEFALKAVRQKTGKKKVAYLRDGYHGLTLGSLAVTASKKYQATAVVPLGKNEYEVSNAYCYRCPHVDNCATQCLDETEKTFDANPDTAALIAEPVQAAGGMAPPKEWWTRLQSMLKKRGILLIADEVQTGCGRTGTMFAIEQYGLEPDVIVGGKGLSGGVGSLAAMIVSDEVGKDFYSGTTPTNGGNAVSAAAGFRLLELLEEEGLIDNAMRAGKQLTEEIAALEDPWVGDIRFKGLLGGVELVSDRASKEPLPKDVVGKIRDGLFDSGILLTVSGPHGNCLRIQPPLSIKAEQISHFVSVLKAVLKKVRG